MQHVRAILMSRVRPAFLTGRRRRSTTPPLPGSAVARVAGGEGGRGERAVHPLVWGRQEPCVLSEVRRDRRSDPRMAGGELLHLRLELRHEPPGEEEVDRKSTRLNS